MATVFHSARLRLLSGKAAWARPAGSQPGGGTANGEFTPHLPDPIKPPPTDKGPTDEPGPISSQPLIQPTQSPKSDGAMVVSSGLVFIRRAKQGLPVGIFASGCNGHQIHLNGMPLMKCGRAKPTGAVAVLKEGDILGVKLGDRFDCMSLWMMFVTQQGEYLFETSDDWNAYLPLDKQRWWDIKNIRPGQQKAEYAADSRPYVDLVKNSAEQAVPNVPKAQPITSPLMGEEKYSDAYLYYVVTVEDLLPKKPRDATD